VTNPLFSIYYIENGFLLMDSEDQITAFTDDDENGIVDRSTECVMRLVGYLGSELLNGYAPPGTRLEIKTYNKYGGDE
jgi:hypothetical protein